MEHHLLYILFTNMPLNVEILISYIQICAQQCKICNKWCKISGLVLKSRPREFNVIFGYNFDHAKKYVQSHKHPSSSHNYISFIT